MCVFCESSPLVKDDVTYPFGLDVVGVEVPLLDELLGLRADGLDALGVRAHVRLQ